jgi:N-alpha-acetyltransferase 50
MVRKYSKTANTNDMAQPTLFSYFSKQPPTIAIPHQSLATIPMNSSSIVIPATSDAHQSPTNTTSTATSSLFAKPNPEQASTTSTPKPGPRPQHLHKAVPESIARSLTTPQPFTITRIDPTHIPALKQLTASILPIAYSPKFYTEAVSDPDVVDFTHVVLAHDRKPVGWITCRVVRSKPGPEEQPGPGSPATVPPDTGHIRPAGLESNRLYIRALCILAPYREQGLASRLLSAVLSDTALLLKHHITGIYAHVWESNNSALDWYERRGFKRVKMEKGYYRRLKPSGAWIVSRTLSVSDLLPAANST